MVGWVDVKGKIEQGYSRSSWNTVCAFSTIHCTLIALPAMSPNSRPGSLERRSVAAVS